MEIMVITYTRDGGSLAKKLISKLSAGEDKIKGFLYQKYQMEGLVSFAHADVLVEKAFKDQIPLVFISSAGIAVRQIAPFVSSKVTDPPVIVMDDRGRHVISLLSGHIGGANELTLRIAGILKADPVITTATDNRGLFAVDVFARKNNLTIKNMGAVKNLSSALINGEKVSIWFDPDYCRAVEGGRLSEAEERSNPELLFCRDRSEQTKPSIIVSPHCEPEDENTVHLVPKCILIGIGCRKNTNREQIEAAIDFVLQKKQIERAAVYGICSIDLKKEEEGICSLAKDWKVPFYTYSAGELQRAEGEFTASSFVSKITGVDNVCERSIAAAGGRLLEKKTIRNQVTVSLGYLCLEIGF